MRYTVNESVFYFYQGIQFGILIGKDIINSETLPADEARLRTAENKMRATVPVDQVRDLTNVALYREIMTKAGINPNKFPPSVEAMFKRILKGGNLPVINALVDLCNAVSIEQAISLGAHDLADIQEDLEVRFSKKGDVFLPFGADAYEDVDEEELVFTSGNVFQTRKWIWRQSELGKTTVNSKDLVFQLVGFDDSLTKAMDDIEQLIINRFHGVCEKHLVDCNNRSVSWNL